MVVHVSQIDRTRGKMADSARCCDSKGKSELTKLAQLRGIWLFSVTRSYVRTLVRTTSYAFLLA